MSDWRQLDLNGANSIARLCGVYEFTVARRIPSGKLKIKVLERSADFIALPNVCVKSATGEKEWTCGIGKNEVEALQDAITRTMADLGSREEWAEEQLAWSDPRDF